jgi:hypothetical protein
VFPPSTDVWDLICAYLAEEVSEGFLREILADRCGWTGNETRAAWFDAVERGKALSDAWSRAKRNTAHSMKCDPRDLGSGSNSATGNG